MLVQFFNNLGYIYFVFTGAACLELYRHALYVHQSDVMNLSHLIRLIIVSPR